MHFGWALLVFWNLRGRVLKICAYIFAGLTALATVGLGEHYCVDLLVAIPFCFIVQALAIREKGKRTIDIGNVHVRVMCRLKRHRNKGIQAAIWQ
jgi:hypothetical protein